MADIMLKDLETDQELDYKALAQLIGGQYGRRMPKKQFHHYCAHHWHHHHHGHHGYGHYRKFRKQCYNYYRNHYIGSHW